MQSHISPANWMHLQLLLFFFNPGHFYRLENSTNSSIDPQGPHLILHLNWNSSSYNHFLFHMCNHWAFHPISYYCISWILEPLYCGQSCDNACCLNTPHYAPAAYVWSMQYEQIQCYTLGHLMIFLLVMSFLCIRKGNEYVHANVTLLLTHNTKMRWSKLIAIYKLFSVVQGFGCSS